ncbi:hypothetical protein evm_009867 [Chilo suppressalis]|nr:hypothetical protein evm_009867 [Chilo suppressalis]
MNTLRIAAFLVVVALSSSSLVQSPTSKDTFELLILHNNDMHARFEQTSQLSGTCTTVDRDAGKCYGGFPRVAHVVKEARKAAASGEGPPVLYLNAGDTYTGTAWFTIYKWKIAAEFLNALQPDAVCLGNGDLNKKSTKQSPLLENINSPILATNVIINSGPINGNIKRSIVLDVKGKKIGLVGYLTPVSRLLENPGVIEYVDEVIALQEEVDKLKNINVNIIIAIGHSTIEKDLEIAKEVDGIDLVIGGHKNIYYWTGENAEPELPKHEKPIVITQPSGRTVPVFQSYSYNKYLGKLIVKFNSNGEIVDFTSNPILLNKSCIQDTVTMDIVKRANLALTKDANEIIGSTAVVLDGQSCRTDECNFGNLITDAIAYHRALHYDGVWTDAPITIMHSGAIAASISPTNRPATITRGNLIESLPLESNLVIVNMTGATLNQILEHSVYSYSITHPVQQFLQISGIRVVYDMSKVPGSRLVRAVARSSGYVPEFYPIDDNLSYSVLMPEILANGGFGYSMLEDLPKTTLTYDEVTCLTEYIRMRSPVYPEVAERISLGNHEFDNGVSGLTPFIENLTCPVLAANLVLNKVPLLIMEPNLMKSIIFDINGTKVGVIGYLTPDTKVLAIRNDVEYIEETVAIKKEAANLKARGVKILIALGHSGFTKDLEIAKKVEDIDLVIGGHTNTFLWNGTSPDSEKPEGPYPMIVKQASGRKVPAVQAYAYTKYLGKLHLVFDSDGELISYDGNPIILDKDVPQDPHVLQIVNQYKVDIEKITELVVGRTSVVLDGDSCRRVECNMGNLIADAMIYKYASDYYGSGWTDAPVSVIQGGGIRASIVRKNLPANVTKGELLSVMPFDGNIVVISVNGSVIREMLEHSVAKYNDKRPPGQFLQYSGLKVEYDFARQPFRRVTNVLIRCDDSCVHMTNVFLSRGVKVTKKSVPSLGNHEFDDNVEGLTPFIENLTSPVLAANLILNKVPELEKQTNIKKSIIFDISGTKVGVVGYLTPETKFLAKSNNVEYIDEITSLKAEIAKLQKEGVKIIIGLGHSGFLRDIEIAKEVEGIDLVIGGHSNTFLWNGKVPDAEISQGPYPTYVKQKSGRSVLVVQAYAYTKYLGKLHIVFNSNGEIITVDGQPILLDKTIPQDPEILKIVEKYKEKLKGVTDGIVGKTPVLLDGLNCQHKECNLGNLITDAIFYTYTENYKGPYWTDVNVAMIQGGGIRASIDHIDRTLSNGDLLTVMPFGGSITKLKINGTTLLKMLEYSCLGNHEFDEGINGVVPFIRNLTSPILAANLILDAVPELANETNLHKSIILKIGDRRIGLIGYLTPETKFLAPKNKVEYEDEVTAIKREVEILKKQNINILIALGHSGFITDLKIAKEVDDIDLVIGGHSNTFLWNRNTTEEKPEFPQGMYPTIVTQPSGRKALVVQAYAYTKYMGYLNLIFDSTGEIVQYDGEPLLLEQSIPEDPEMLEKVNLYRKEIDEINNELVGESAVVLEGSCRLQECNLGNLITDSILDFTREFHPKYFDVNIAVIQGGRIRTSVDHPNKPIKVTRGDLVAVLPFSDMLTIITLNGTILKRAMEHSISTWRLIDSTGQFLQMSGMEVTYDLSQSPGSRLVDLKAVCSKCGDYTLKPVNDNNEYKMFMPSFLADGGDGYSIFENLPKDIISYNELECTINYMRKYGLVEPKVSGRITIINRDKINDIKANPLLNNCIRSTVSLALEIICVLISLNFL